MKAEGTWLWSPWLCCAKPIASNPQDPPRELTARGSGSRGEKLSVKSVVKLKGCDSLLLVKGRWDLPRLQTRSWRWQQISVTLGGLGASPARSWCVNGCVLGELWGQCEGIHQFCFVQLPHQTPPVTPTMGPSIVQCFTGVSLRCFDLSYRQPEQAKLIKVCSKVILHRSFCWGADNQVLFIYLFVNKAV